MLDAGPGLMGRRERLIAGNGALLASCSFCGSGCARGFGASGERAWDFGDHRSDKAIGQLAMYVATSAACSCEAGDALRGERIILRVVGDGDG